MSLATTPKLIARRIVARTRLAFPPKIRRRIVKQSSKAVTGVSVGVVSSLITEAFLSHHIPTLSDVDRDSREGVVSIAIQYLIFYYLL